MVFRRVTTRRLPPPSSVSPIFFFFPTSPSLVSILLFSWPAYVRWLLLARTKDEHRRRNIRSARFKDAETMRSQLVACCESLAFNRRFVFASRREVNYGGRQDCTGSFSKCNAVARVGGLLIRRNDDAPSSWINRGR